jgi:hypothetical protein
MIGITSSPYTWGNVTIVGGAAAINIWQAVQSQLDGQCDGGPVSLLLDADLGNTSDVLIGGSPSVSPTSYGYNLSPGVTRLYSASTRYGIVPFARLYAYSANNAILHVEVYP